MSQAYPVVPRYHNFEDVLQKTGFGLYYKFLIGFTSFSSFTNGLALLSLYFAVPLTLCDVETNEKSIITIHIAFILGKVFGGFVLCSISDNIGHHRMIPISLVFIFASCFIAAFSHNIYTLYIAAIFLGSGIQTNSIVTKVHLAEILSIQDRGFYLTLPDLFWTLGYFTTTAMTYFMHLTNTTVVERHNVDMRLTFWRIMFALAGGAAITIACISALVEMSPRYLLVKRRFISTTLLLKQFYAINHSKYSETFEIYSQDLYGMITDYQLNIYPDPTSTVQAIVVAFKIMGRMVKLLLWNRFVVVVMVIILMRVPGMFGIVGINIFLSMNLGYNNSYVNGSNFLYTEIYFGNNRKNCTISQDIGGQLNFMMLSTCIFMGQVMLLCIGQYGRKISIFGGLVACSVASFVLAFTKTYLFKTIASSIFVMGYTMSESLLTIITIESFPTVIRSSVVAKTSLYSLLLSCLVYLFLHVSYEVFLILFGSLFLGVSVLTYFIPEMKGRPMVE